MTNPPVVCGSFVSSKTLYETSSKFKVVVDFGGWTLIISWYVLPCGWLSPSSFWRTDDRFTAHNCRNKKFVWLIFEGLYYWLLLCFSNIINLNFTNECPVSILIFYKIPVSVLFVFPTFEVWEFCDLCFEYASTNISILCYEIALSAHPIRTAFLVFCWQLGFHLRVVCKRRA